MTPQSKALGVHLLTSTGAVFAMLAMLAAAEGRWDLMWFWLLVAFVVDGVDGPLARRFEVRRHAPQINGALLDLTIDYLTYVFIPAFALFSSGLLPGWTGWFSIIAITFASVVYFVQDGMKTRDASFKGFPGCWNMVVIVIFATEPNFWLILGMVAFFSVAMFLPLKFIHPVRTARWKIVSLPIAFAWIVFAGWAAWIDFAAGSWAHWGLVLTSLYLVSAGIAQQVIHGRDG